MRRTRRGYVVCGGCHRHVQLALFDGTESCSFCGTRVDANAAGQAPSAARAGGPRSAFVFAALLGASSVGCGTAEEKDPVQDSGPDLIEDDISIDALYGAPPDVDDDATTDADPVDTGPPDVRPDIVDEDIPAEPLYGGPPEDIFEDTRPDIIDEEIPAEPLYGMPAEDVIDDDVPAEPPYGIPPMPDAWDDEDIEDPMPMPEYGLPPE